MKKISSRVSLLLVWPLLLSGCSVFGGRTVEEPVYQVHDSFQEIEIRKYDSMIVANTTVRGMDYDDAQTEAFRRLAGFIFGKNRKQQKVATSSGMKSSEGQQSTAIAMTAPVSQVMEGRNYTMTFMMPQTYSLANLPQPIDKRVVFATTPPRYLAVVDFSWFGSAKRYANYEDRLRKVLADNDCYQSTGLAIYAGYNPPWTLPFLRRNEVMVEVRPCNSKDKRASQGSSSPG